MSVRKMAKKGKKGKVEEEPVVELPPQKTSVTAMGHRADALACTQNSLLGVDRSSCLLSVRDEELRQEQLAATLRQLDCQHSSADVRVAMTRFSLLTWWLSFAAASLVQLTSLRS
jgi:hypothetical protein